MGRIFHLSHNPLDAYFSPRRPVGQFRWLTTSTMRWQGRNAQLRIVKVRDANDVEALLVVDDTETVDLDTAVTGAGGLSEAVGNARSYDVRIIAKRDGSDPKLWGVRLGTTPALPADYVWQSLPWCLALTDGSGDLRQFRDPGGGWIEITTATYGLSCFTNGADTSPTAVNLQTIGGPAEFISNVANIVKVRVWSNCANNQATSRQLIIQRLVAAAGPGYHTVVQCDCSTAAGNVSALPVHYEILIGDPTQSMRYYWSGAITGGFSVYAQAVQYDED